jgi:DNA ligase 1
MLLHSLVEVSREIGSTRSRTRKVELLAAALTGLSGDERDIGVAYLTGEPRQPRLDLGPAAVMGIEVAPAARPSLTLAEVDETLQQIADVATGTGSRTRRIARLSDLLGRAVSDEQRWLRALVLRELRQGSLEGLFVQAVARAAGVPEGAVRRAAMISGDLRATTTAAMTGGEDALAAFRLEVGVPLQPMLASTSTDVAAALDGLGEVVLEAKLDGARVQVHRSGDMVHVYTRSLQEVTHRVPEVVDAARSLPVTAVVLDGETMAFDDAGRPRPFQETMQRFGREHDATAVRQRVPLEVRFFDVLHLDGRDVLDQPLRARREALHRAVPDALRVEGRVQPSDDTDGATAFLDHVLQAGHEGAMIKDLDAPYEAGRRGASWRKLKPVHTLDLVVLAAEWGSGRRKGWLSNLHLGARADGLDGARDTDADAARDTDGVDGTAAPGRFVMLGKTFKGLTDETLTWQTEALLARETHREGHVVHVHPDLVVEIALDGLVRSTRYPGGLALRFARVRGYRPDKPASEADTLATAHAIHRGERLPTG